MPQTLHHLATDFICDHCGKLSKRGICMFGLEYFCKPCLIAHKKACTIGLRALKDGSPMSFSDEEDD
jgi:hypothetical protein